MKTQPLAAMALAAVFLAGCSQETVTSVKRDVDKNAVDAKKQIDKAAQEAQPAIRKLDNGARVTAAIQANENLDGTSISVDAETNGVKLRGTVKTAEQKQLAERVAKDTLSPGKTVEDDLTVSS